MNQTWEQEDFLWIWTLKNVKKACSWRGPTIACVQNAAANKGLKRNSQINCFYSLLISLQLLVKIKAQCHSQSKLQAFLKLLKSVTLFWHQSLETDQCFLRWESFWHTHFAWHQFRYFEIIVFRINSEFAPLQNFYDYWKKHFDDELIALLNGCISNANCIKAATEFEYLN